MTLQQLLYLAAIAKHRSFTRAAATCKVAQPALSQQIRKLEEELGVRMLERTKRGAELTAAGSEFLTYAEKSLDLLSEGRRRVSDLRALRLGRVRLLCPTSVGTYWLPAVILRFRQRYPAIEIQIYEQAGCTVEHLAETVADVGILQLDPRAEARLDRPVHEEVLFVDEQVLVLPSAHPLARSGNGHQGVVRLSAAAKEPFVLHKAPCGLSLVAARAFLEAGIPPRVTLETSQVEAVCQMVAAGLGVGLMPRAAMQRPRAGIRWRPLTDPTPKRTVGLVWFVDRTLSPAAQGLVEVLREEAARTETLLSARALRPEGPPS